MTIFRGYLDPNWNIEEFHNLQYCPAIYHDFSHIEDYVSCGHKEDNLTIFKYKEPNPMPKCVYNYIFPNFEYLKNKSCAINLFNPANYLPYHKDSFEKYEEIFGKSNNVCRYMVMLEDWSPGQILLIGDQSYSGWKSGDYYGWSREEPHSFYNMSNVKRYALQITGDLNEKSK
jgi:hypothetical protein